MKIGVEAGIFSAVKKKIASTILEKSRIPSIQVVTNVILHNLYRRIFLFFSNRKGRFYANIALYVIGYETTTEWNQQTNEPILESRDIGLQHNVTEKAI